MMQKINRLEDFRALPDNYQDAISFFGYLLQELGVRYRNTLATLVITVVAGLLLVGAIHELGDTFGAHGMLALAKGVVFCGALLSALFTAGFAYHFLKFRKIEALMIKNYGIDTDTLKILLQEKEKEVQAL